LLIEREVKSVLKWKTTLLILLLFVANSFAMTSTVHVMANKEPTFASNTTSPGGGSIEPLGDPVPGGGGGGGDD